MNIKKKIPIFNFINWDIFKNMSYLEFLEWYKKIYESEYEYVKNYKYSGFQIQFAKISINWCEKKIYPIYPWNENFKSLILGQKYYINENARLVRENKVLKKKIKNIFSIRKIKKIKKYRPNNDI